MTWLDRIAGRSAREAAPHDHPRPGRRAWRLGMALATLALTLVCSSMAWATVMKFADLGRLIELSDVIVHGTVVDQKTYFDMGQGFVVTDTTVRTDTPLFGKIGPNVTFQQWGGTHEGRRHVLPGDATFTKGEEVILFLYRGNEGSNQGLFLSAMAQSKYRVYKREDGRTMVVRDLDQVAFLVAPGQPGMQHRQERPETLKSFLATLESEIAAIKGGTR